MCVSVSSILYSILRAEEKRRERGIRDDDGVLYIYILYSHCGGRENRCESLQQISRPFCVHYNNMYTSTHTHTIRVYNGQSGDINNANGGSTSRSNLAEDVVKVYIVRCVLIYTRPQVNLSYTSLVPDITCTGARADVVVLIA